MSTSESSAILASGGATTVPSMHLVFRSIRRALLYIALSIAAFISIFPFYWMVVGSTNSSPDIAHGKITPGTYLFENIAAFFATVDVARMFWNSTFLALVGVALTLTVSSLAGYGFEVFKSRLRDRIFGLLLLTLSIPFAALMVPLFIMMSQLKYQHVRCSPAPRHRFGLPSSTSARRRRPFRASSGMPRASMGSTSGRSSRSSTCR